MEKGRWGGMEKGKEGLRHKKRRRERRNTMKEKE